MTDDEKFIKVWNDPVLFINNFLSINDKKGKLVPFILNKPQQDFIRNMSTYNQILKSRQIGFSVAICGLAIFYAVTQPNSTCMMLSMSDESCRALFNKLKNIYHTLPTEIKPKLKRNNRAELQLENGSIISCTTLGQTDKGRGNTCKLIHISEFAFVKSDVAEKQLLSLEQTLQSGDSHLIIESTANGLNFFSALWNKSQKKENTYKGFFYNYIDGACMFEDEYKRYKEIFKEINGHYFSENDLTEEEMELLKLKDMTLDILCWRRMKIQNSSVDKFNQEFPLTPSQAFITSGHTIFDNERITNTLRVLQLNKNKFIKKSELEDLPQILKKYYGRSFFIYKKLKQGEKAWIGVDTSEGVGKDYSTAIVLNKDGEELAMFQNNKIKAYEYAEFINALGRYFNKAYLCVEKASAGHSVISRLRNEFKYMNMSKYKTYDQFNKPQYTVGFDTNSKTKGIIVNDLVEMFEKGQLLLHSEGILEEMKTFESKDNSGFGSMSGFHDDLVMALCLAIAALKEGKWYKWN
ncbi:terminase large subunit domain-containing protein [Clostridium beijerinckii]|uniref:Terminase large subunit gp17-like C-terminal domain-containing protein n=1 Tax=Clostridium beijerinckii TaxID=1520 RepID=A0AAX0B372_CLOBE|nr:terminase family protein [Clostridium beijerinckii]NRT88884.1 hypothetical protein [Clostridium beijerinckii]NYC74339.1 hypothetical protein [Clostridium beijerinckii]